MSLTSPLGGSPRKLSPALGFPPVIGVVEPYVFPGASSAYSFVVPYTGEWKFVGWGPGGSGSPSGGGGSGGYFEISRNLVRGQVVTITAGIAAVSDTSVALPDGSTATATRANGATQGAGSGGDYNLDGSAGVAAGTNPGNAGLGTGGGAGGTAGSGSGGSGAPARLPYRGGRGGVGSGTGGVGAGSGEQGVATIPGASGLVLAVLMSA
jgi:hypothetical protein